MNCHQEAQGSTNTHKPCEQSCAWVGVCVAIDFHKSCTAVVASRRELRATVGLGGEELQSKLLWVSFIKGIKQRGKALKFSY